MNKAELVEALAQHYDGSKTEAAKALDAVVQTITRSTVAGERVAITGFGVFERVERPARMVRNPRTGERKEAAATAVPRFRAGTELKAYVAGQRQLPDLAPGTGGTAASRTGSRRPAAVARPATAQEALVAEVVATATDQPGASSEAGSTTAGKKKKAAGKKGAGSTKADSTKAESTKAGSKRDAGKKSAGKKDAGKGKKGAATQAEAKKSGKKSKK